MNLNNFIPEEIITAIGWTIVHSLWQGIFVAVILGIILILLSRQSAKVRSYISYGALIVLTVAAVKTFTEYYQPGPAETIQPKDLETFLLNVSEVNTSETSTNSLLAEVKNGATGLLQQGKTFFHNNSNLIVSIWFAGVLILLFRLMGGFIFTQRIKKKKTIPVSEIWELKLFQLTEKMQIKKSIKFVQSAIVKTPMVIGYFKPVVLFPLSVFSGMPHSQIEAILAHELAHIKRADYLLNILQSIIEIIFFFNPAVHIISHTIRKEREFACDESAIRACGSNTDLASALLAVQGLSNRSSTFAIAATGNKNSLLSRIKKMAHQKNEPEFYTKKLTAVFILTVLLSLITVAACSSNIEDLNTNDATALSLSNEANMGQSSLSTSFTKTIKDEKDLLETEGIDATIFNEDDDRQVFSFYDDESGDEVHWKVIIKDEEIVEAYRDDEKLSDEEIEENEEYIFETLAKLKEGLEEIEKIDLEGLEESLSNLNFNFNMKFDSLFNFKFDSESFETSMDALHEGLAQLNEHDFHFEFDNEKFEFDFDSEEFKEGMAELKENLEELKDLDFDFEFDQEAFKEGMKEFKQNMKDFKFDMKDFKTDMKDFKVDMGNFKEEMKELKVELKKLGSFLDEVKEELIADGYLDEDAEDFELDLDENGMVVNGKKLPDELHQKYLDLYEKHYDKELEENFRIR